MLDQAFEALQTYNWGADKKALNPIEEAVVATRDDPAARQDLEKRLREVLASDVSRDAKDYVCRKLRVVGTAASVPALAKLLDQPEHSHMARYALESMPAPEAAQALRDALPRLQGQLKIGVLGSLGVRQDEASVGAIAVLLDDPDQGVARSAALALGAIRSAAAAKALQSAQVTNPKVRVAVTDASLACAEALLEGGNKVQALALYKKLSAEDQPKHVRLAATRGMLDAAGASQ
jgi:HEAT repeat protein